MTISAALRGFHRPRLWLGIGCAGVVLCVALSLISPPDIPLEVPEGDKLGHFLAYLTLSAWSVLIFLRPRHRLLAGFWLVLLGGAIEVAQGTLTVDRMMDLRDALANTLGVVAGQLLSLTRAQTLLQRLDARLFG